MDAGGAAVGGGAGDVSTQTAYSETTSVDQADTGAGAMPDTGGEPLLMTLLGSLTAGSALLLRRRLS